MTTFTEEIKNEILKKPIEDEGCGIAFLSAFIRTNGSVISLGGNYGFEFVTENEKSAEYVCSLFGSLFGVNLSVVGAELDSKSYKDKLKVEYIGAEAPQILSKLKLAVMSDDAFSLLLGIDDELVSDKNRATAYILGAFLGSGSCTLPDEQTYSKTGYHFEIVFSNKYTACDFADVLCGFDILVKTVTRKDSVVVYAKSKEVISDILSVMQTYKCLKKLNKIVEFKDKCNNDNRISNCSVSNIDKTVTASVAQIKAIEIIAQTVGLQSLDANLFEVAEARLADKNASMQELADRLSISKSCINHRMRKLAAMAAQLM